MSWTSMLSSGSSRKRALMAWSMKSTSGIGRSGRLNMGARGPGASMMGASKPGGAHRGVLYVLPVTWMILENLRVIAKSSVPCNMLSEKDLLDVNTLRVWRGMIPGLYL